MPKYKQTNQNNKKYNRIHFKISNNTNKNKNNKIFN